MQYHARISTVYPTYVYSYDEGHDSMVDLKQSSLLPLRDMTRFLLTSRHTLCMRPAAPLPQPFPCLLVGCISIRITRAERHGLPCNQNDIWCKLPRLYDLSWNDSTYQQPSQVCWATRCNVQQNICQESKWVPQIILFKKIGTLMKVLLNMHDRCQKRSWQTEQLKGKWIFKSLDN